MQGLLRCIAIQVLYCRLGGAGGRLYRETGSRHDQLGRDTTLAGARYGRWAHGLSVLLGARPGCAAGLQAVHLVHSACF